MSERLLALLLKKTESIAETVKVAAFMPVRDFEFLTVFLENNGNFSQIRSTIPADWRARLDFLYMLGDFELGKVNSDFDLGKEIIAITKEIEREHYKESLLKIGVEIKKCEAAAPEGGAASGEPRQEREPRPAVAGREVDLHNLTKEFQNISKKLNDLSKNQSHSE